MSFHLNKISRPLLVAEISGNHNKNKKLFLDHIRLAAKNGADLVKIQTYEPQDITLKKFSPKFKITKGLWKNKFLWNLYKDAHTPFQWHKDAFALAKKLKITLFSSPFSKRAVDLLESFNVKLYKISSFELTDLELIDYIAKKRKPIIISTGMANIREIKKALSCITKYHKKIIILYCVSGYPSKEKDINLNTIKKFKKIFKGYKIGLSDHTNDILTSLASTVLGVSLIEKHFIVSKKIRSPDKDFSIDCSQLRQLRNGIKKIYLSLGVEKIGLKKIEKDSVKLRRSIFTKKNIKKGDFFRRDNICNLRPSIGIKSENYKKILGKKAKKDISINSSLFHTDIK